MMDPVIAPTEQEMISGHLRTVVDRVDSLPTLPVVVSRILSAMESPKTSANDIQRIVATDQAITAKILKLVNSSFYGFPRRIGSISEAVVILGFNTVRNLAITCSVFHCFGHRHWKGFDPRAFWNHCIGTAVLGKYLGRKFVPNLDGEEIFVMGLLHDIGKLIIERFCPDEFTRILKRVHEEEMSFYKAEELELGVTHAEVGSWLCQKWNLPVRLSEVVAHHHDPSVAKEGIRHASIIHLANAFAHHSGQTYIVNPKGVTISKRVIELLRIPPTDLKNVEQEIPQELENASEFFNLY